MVENIKHFVMPLRAEHILIPMPIVILNDEELTAKQWQQLSYFTQIYYVTNSAFEYLVMYIGTRVSP